MDIKDTEPDIYGDSAPLFGEQIILPEAWKRRLEQARQEAAPAAEPVRNIPRSANSFAGQLNVVENATGAEALATLARQIPLGCIGIDFEFRYCRPGVLVKRVKGKDRYWHDPRSVVPLLLAVALMEQQVGSQRIIRYIVNCRRRDAVAALSPLFSLPIPFVTHFARAELFCLWQLGLPSPAQVWDTWAAERCLLLGLHHANYKTLAPADEAEEAEAKELAEEEAEFACGLTATCLRRGIPYPCAGDKDRMQKSFLTHPDGTPFSREQLEYAAADAVAAARLYPVQVQTAVELGCLNHLTRVEMDWSVTNAAMSWNGVHVAPADAARLREACQRHMGRLQQDLQALGLNNPKSYPQVKTFFEQAGLLELFRTQRGYSFDDDHLESVEDRHPAIPLIRAVRKVSRLMTDKAFTGALVGADGRLHPEHNQLGAASGRNSMRWPNIGGIGRALRPIVTPEEGYAIGEVDLSQIEVGIAAAVYGDQDLIAMFNGSDVYSAMARRVYEVELPAEALALPDKDFKKKYRDLRNRMKVCTLAVIYNITPRGLSVQLGISVEKARQQLERFFAMFRELSEALRRASEDGVIRGYAYLCSGLRRWRPCRGFASQWEVNWMRNTPVQGSAGIVFKVAGNRLHRRFLHYDAKLILPMHDAFVFEVPRQHLTTVAKITAEVLRSAVQEFFPQLNPQVEINIDHPDSWNKDGRWRSLALWMVHPEHARRYL